MSHYRISINHRALDDISKGIKTIEGRIKKGIFNHISKNDFINFYNKDRTLEVKVVNIIEYNSIDQGKFQQAQKDKVDTFASYLESQKVIVNVRRSRGKDIDAACGQLANKNNLGN